MLDLQTICKNKCKFGICDPIDGSCQCSLGYQGENCDNKCKEKTFGFKCKMECNCNNTSCDHITGICPNNESPKRSDEDSDKFSLILGIYFLIYHLI